MGPLHMATPQSHLLRILIPQQQPAGSSSPWKAPVGKDTLSVPLLGGGPHCIFSVLFALLSCSLLWSSWVQEVFFFFLGTQGAVGLGCIDNFWLGHVTNCRSVHEVPIAGRGSRPIAWAPPLGAHMQLSSPSSSGVQCGNQMLVSGIWR